MNEPKLARLYKMAFESGELFNDFSPTTTTRALDRLLPGYKAELPETVPQRGTVPAQAFYFNARSGDSPASHHPSSLALVMASSRLLTPSFE